MGAYRVQDPIATFPRTLDQSIHAPEARYTSGRQEQIINSADRESELSRTREHEDTRDQSAKTKCINCFSTEYITIRCRKPGYYCGDADHTPIHCRIPRSTWPAPYNQQPIVDDNGNLLRIQCATCGSISHGSDCTATIISAEDRDAMNVSRDFSMVPMQRLLRS